MMDEKQVETNPGIENKNEKLEEKLDIPGADNSESFPWIFAIISIFLAGVAAIIIYLAVAPSKAGDIDMTGSETNMENFSNSVHILDGKYYPPYQLKNSYEGKSWTGEQKLINEKNETIISNLSEIIPSLKTSDNQYLSIFAQPQGADYIILEMKEGPENGILYKFNINSKTLIKIKANDIFTKQSTVLSLSNNHRNLILLSTNDEMGLEQTIYTIDLLNGDYKVLDSLKENETTNAGWDTDRSFSQIEWIDKETISIAIFDQSKKMAEPVYLLSPYIPTTAEAENIYIEQREYKIK